MTKLTTSTTQTPRVISGMRATGKLHLGNYLGALKNWVQLQHNYECFFFVADLHALTTDYADPRQITENTWNIVIDWLAAGVNPELSKIFIQSQVPEHAELHLLLSMIIPLSWLERVPTYKDQQQKLMEKDLSTYGFLGYPLLQSADVLLYKAGLVPVGEDQSAHIELVREVARRFNYLYGREPDFINKAEKAVDKLGKKIAQQYRDLRKQFQEQGDHEALSLAQTLLQNQHNLALGDRERLIGYLEGGGKIILPEPQTLLTETAKLTGLDGQKMSKSYNNTILLREEPAVVEQKIKVMPTDPARIKRTDPGDPEKCPVWALHKIYSDTETKAWVQQGCRSAGIGCLECKKSLSNTIIKEHAPIVERGKMYEANPSLVRTIVAEGAIAAREVAKATIEEVKSVMGLIE